jgi:ectoine hydroxylase-related dioxygenase (phytanoyl-CoA dioxygenase family)
VANVCAALDEFGAVIVEGLLSYMVIDAVNREVEPHVAEADPDMRHLNPAIQYFHAKARHVTGLAAKSPTFATAVMMHPLLLAICDRVLAPSCARYQLNLAHLLERMPGADDQMLHRDEDVWNLLPRPHPELQVASVIAMVDFARENGATRLVPGSHRWERGRAASEADMACAEMPAGSAVVYLGSTLHAGGGNVTNTPRRGVHLSYTLGWLRTEENNYLAVPPAIASTLPRDCQALLGYAVHDAIATGGGYLGMLDLRDPLEVLGER